MEEGWQTLPSRFDQEYSMMLRKSMRYLSEDARMSILELSKKLGVSRRTIRDKLLKAESEMGIKYTTEFNETALGLSNPHLIRIRFSKEPNYSEILRVLSSSYIPQLAVTTKGSYDLFIYANAITSSEYVHWDKKTQIMLSKYGVLWNSSDVAHMHLGFFPIRNELLDRASIPSKDKELLKMLNTNSRVSFSEISKRLNMHFNTVAYNFNRLIRSGYIKRFTLSTDMPKNAAVMTIFSKYLMSEHYEEDSAKSRIAFRESGTEYPIINRYPIVLQLVGSSDVFIMGVMDDADTAYHHVVSEYKKIFSNEKPRIEHGRVDKVILGRLPFRSIDTKKEYNVIKWTVDKSDLLQ
ncbi:MAG: winged helix-turn-helix transcriptional regulator [Candidatus Micrarchaeaceae archaeon]